MRCAFNNRSSRRFFVRGRLERLEDRVTPGFLAPITSAADTDVNAEAVGDFNGDGIADLAVANETSASVSVLLGKGDGSFRPPVNYPVGVKPMSVAVADFNGDGNLDFAVTDYINGFGTVSIFLGNGDGTFRAAGNYNAGQIPSSVAVGDFDGDGTPDLAVANDYGFDGSTVSVLLGNGDGTFRPAVAYDAGSFPVSVAVGDFNGDGIPDLVVANSYDSSGGDQGVSVLLGNGDGTFQRPCSFPAGSHPGDVAVGDFTGSGVLDLAVLNEGPDSSLSVLLGDGYGDFGPAVNYAVGSDPFSVAVGDFNRDGVADVAVANSAFSGGTPSVSVFLAKGDGTFGPATSYDAGGYPKRVAVGDFNRDGFPDVVTTNYGAGTVSVLLNDGSWASGSGDSPSRGAGQGLPSLSAVPFPVVAGPPTATAEQRGVVHSGDVNIGAYQASATAFVLSAPDTVQAGVPFDVTSSLFQTDSSLLEEVDHVDVFATSAVPERVV
jgi:hypothetical protein